MKFRGSPAGIAASALAFALALAACSGNGDQQGAATGDDQVDDVADADVDEEPPPEDESADVVLAEYADLPYAERVEALEECARDEGGTVLVYGASNVEMQEAYAEGFRETYDFIDYQYIRMSSSDLGPRVLAEARAGRYLADVIQIGTANALELNDDDLFAQHHGVPVPDGTPESVVEDWFVMNQINPNIIVWNTDLVSDDEAPRTVDDLTTERFSDGRMAIDSAPIGFVQGLIIERGEDGAREYLETLVEQGVAVRVGFTNITNLLAAGEFHTAILYADAVERLIDEGAPLDWEAPDPTAGHGVGVGIAKYTASPCTAALVMHYLLDPNGGAEAMADTGRVPTHPDTPFPYPELIPFLEEGTELNARLLPLTPALVADTEATALDLVEEILVPHMVE